MLTRLQEDPLWLFDISHPKALLVVAHADDETIFAGGLILSSRKTEWTHFIHFSLNPPFFP